MAEQLVATPQSMGCTAPEMVISKVCLKHVS
eukprot:SAG31_NODE_39621_length_287_cov_0.484043_1_plen_30_part_10